MCVFHGQRERALYKEELSSRILHQFERVWETKAYVLITTRSGTAEKVAATIYSIKGVTSAECVYGHYDVIAIVESPDMKVLSSVVHEIQRQPGVLHTETAFSHYAEDYESEMME